MYLPFMQDLFHTAPLSASQWALATAAGAVVVPVVAVEKLVRRRRQAIRSSHAATAARR